MTGWKERPAIDLSLTSMCLLHAALWTTRGYGEQEGCSKLQAGNYPSTFVPVSTLEENGIMKGFQHHHRSISNGMLLPWFHGPLMLDSLSEIDFSPGDNETGC